jgi:replicative DNA helicase
MVNTTTLPTNVEVEKLVLGSILLDETHLHDCRLVLSGDDFSLDKNRRIWKQTVDLYDGGKHVDRVTVSQALHEAGELHAVELSYLAGLEDGLPRLPDLASYIGILKDEAARRRIMFAGQQMIQRAANRDKPQEILDSMSGFAVDMAVSGNRKGPVSCKELIERVGISEILAPRIARGVQFPWRWMNDSTCGMLPSELWVLAAHTSAGKTSAAIQTAVDISRHQTKSVVFFSLEMADVSVFQRAVWQMSRVDSGNAKRNRLTQDERAAVNQAVNVLQGLNLYWDDSSYSITEIHANLRRIRSRGPIGLVVVDYLQLLRDSGRHGTRAEAVGANARALKILAGEFECPVLLLNQFNRESAKDKRRPELYDLKESGDIENHANGVWFLYRPDDTDSDQISVEFMLPKQRDGRRNIRQEFWYMPKCQRFDPKEEVAE